MALFIEFNPVLLVMPQEPGRFHPRWQRCRATTLVDPACRCHNVSASCLCRENGSRRMRQARTIACLRHGSVDRKCWRGCDIFPLGVVASLDPDRFRHSLGPVQPRARWRDEGDTAGYRQVWKETEGWGVVTAAAQRPWAESLGSRPCAPNHSGSAVTKWRRIKMAIGITHTALSEVQRTRSG